MTDDITSDQDDEMFESEDDGNKVSDGNVFFLFYVIGF